MSSFVLAHKNNNKVAYSKSSSTFTKASKPPPRNRTDNSYDMLVSSSSNRVFHLQKSIGNQAIQKLLNGNPLHDLGNKIQTKLKVNNPGDVYEHEADKIADQVMKMSSSSESKPNLISSTIHNERSDSEKCSECKIKEQEPEVKNISRKPFTNSSDLEVTDKITNEIGDIRANSSLILDSSTKTVYLSPMERIS